MVPQPTVTDSEYKMGPQGLHCIENYNKNHGPGTEGNLEAIFSFQQLKSLSCVLQKPKSAGK